MVVFPVAVRATASKLPWMDVTQQSLIVQGLLVVFLSVLLTAVVLVLAILGWIRHKSRAIVAQKPQCEAIPPEPMRELPAFSPRRCQSWLAIRSTNVGAVQFALNLHDPKPCSWTEGVMSDADQRLFVSPPISGWILVIGPALPDPADDVDKSFRFICDLSRKLGYVQFFHVNQVLDQHAWVRAEAGRIGRAYAWAGRTLWHQGPVTPAEMSLGMKCLEYGEAPEPALFSRAEAEPGNSEKVHLLAARWSVNPAAIDGRFLGAGRGVAGEVSRFF